MNIKSTICGLCIVLSVAYMGNAQTQDKETSQKKTWEIGIGGSLINWNRVSISDFQKRQDSYFYNLNVNHVMGGAKFHVARELNRWFYIDLQGTLGITKKEAGVSENSTGYDYFAMAGPGLQLRLNPLFSSENVEPYLRIGAQYLQKSFPALSAGSFYQDPTGKAYWEADDTWNSNTRISDKNRYFPLSLGVGMNAWLNNSVGINLQGEYVMPIRKELPHFAQVSIQILFSFGGKEKRFKPQIQYVEIEKIIEKPIEKIVERVIEKTIPISSDLLLLANVNFNFNQYSLTPQAEKILDQVAQALKDRTDEYYLINGYTDAKGDSNYNIELSQKRAKSVVDALIKRGVPSSMLKWRGLGKKVHFAHSNDSDKVREADRKITIERISNIEYWNKLP